MGKTNKVEIASIDRTCGAWFLKERVIPPSEQNLISPLTI